MADPICAYCGRSTFRWNRKEPRIDPQWVPDSVAEKLKFQPKSKPVETREFLGKKYHFHNACYHVIAMRHEHRMMAERAIGRLVGG